MLRKYLQAKTMMRIILKLHSVNNTRSKSADLKWKTKDPQQKILFNSKKCYTVKVWVSSAVCWIVSEIVIERDNLISAWVQLEGRLPNLLHPFTFGTWIASAQIKLVSTSQQNGFVNKNKHRIIYSSTSFKLYQKRIASKRGV